MKKYTGFIAIAFAILAFSFSSVDAQSFSGAGSVRTIEQNVKRQILRMPRYEVFDHIAYSVNGGTVTLYGKVRNAINRTDAENRVEDVPGVSAVINSIQVLPLGSFDEAIRRDLYRTLAGSGGLSRYLWTANPSVRLVVDRGHIALEGLVANRGDYNRMNILAHSVSGAFSVQNNLVVENDRAR